MTTPAAPHDVLLVEDSVADLLLMQEAFGDARTLRLSAVQDGEDALAYLRGEGEYGGAPRPKLVLLDLNMPRLNGFEVLAAMRADEQLRSLPVVVLSTSEAEKDVRLAYTLGANAYITKPRGFAGFFDLVRHLEDFWMNTARLPGLLN